MAITYVGAATWIGTATNGGNVSITVSSLQAGDYIVANVGIGSSRSPTITVTSSSTAAAYTALITALHLPTQGMHMGTFGKLLTAADTIVQTFGTGNSSDSTTMTLLAFRGVDPASPIDVTATSTTDASGTTNPNSPSITVASCGCAIITAVNAMVNDTAVTAPSSFLNQVNENANDNWDTTSGMAWITLSSTSPFDPAPWTNFTNSPWGAATVALRPAPPPVFTYQDYFPQFADFYRTTELVGY